MGESGYFIQNSIIQNSALKLGKLTHFIKSVEALAFSSSGKLRKRVVPAPTM